MLDNYNQNIKLRFEKWIGQRHISSHSKTIFGIATISTLLSTGCSSFHASNAMVQEVDIHDAVHEEENTTKLIPFLAVALLST